MGHEAASNRLSAACPQLLDFDTVSQMRVSRQHGGKVTIMRIDRRKPMRKIATTLIAATAVCALAAMAQAQTILKASHQFPGGKGDPRDEMVQIIAKEAKAANVGIDVQVYPGASLFKPNDQWNAMVSGQLDI